MPFWGRRKRTSIQRPKTLKELCSEAFRRELEKDPTLMKKVAFKEMGHSELIDDTNPIQVKKQEIKSRIIDRALKKIDEDPELAERFVESQLEDIIGEGHRGERYEGGYEGTGSAIRQALEELEDVEEFRDRVGGKSKGSALGGLIDSETIKEIIKAFRAYAGAPREIPEEPLIVIRVDGQLRKVPESEFRRLEQQGLFQPVAALEQPTEVPKPQPEERVIVKPAEIPESGPELPDIVSMFDFNQILAYMEQSPEDFVEQLKSEVQGGIETSIFLWNILSTMNYDDMVNLVSSYKDDAQVGYVVTKILENREWLEKAISLIREGVEDE